LSFDIDPALRWLKTRRKNRPLKRRQDDKLNERIERRRRTTLERVNVDGRIQQNGRANRRHIGDPAEQVFSPAFCFA
jgi:hypothetical protein